MHEDGVRGVSRNMTALHKKISVCSKVDDIGGRRVSQIMTVDDIGGGVFFCLFSKPMMTSFVNDP